MKITLNKVEGFDPSNAVETAVDNNGNPIVKNDGKPLQFISTSKKVEWFRRVYPKGALLTKALKVNNLDDGLVVKYQADVYLDINDNKPVATCQHQSIVYDHESWNTAVSRVQTIALGKALSRAGFGCEIENNLGLDDSEETNTTPEQVEEPKPIKKRGRPKKEAAPVAEVSPVAEKPADELSDIEMLLSETEASSNQSDTAKVAVVEEVVETDEILENAYETVIETTPKCVAAMAKFSGMTIREALSVRPDFCESIVDKARVRACVSEETQNAADYIVSKVRG